MHGKTGPSIFGTVLNKRSTAFGGGEYVWFRAQKFFLLKEKIDISTIAKEAKKKQIIINPVLSEVFPCFSFNWDTWARGKRHGFRHKKRTGKNKGPSLIQDIKHAANEICVHTEYVSQTSLKQKLM